MREIVTRYPTFTNSQLFMQLCTQLEQNGNMTQLENTEINRYHTSVIYKLKTSIFSLENIQEIINNSSYLPPLTITTGSHVAAGIQHAQQQVEFDEFYQLRLFQDILFHALIGALDFISLKINLIYAQPILNIRDCSFRNIDIELQNMGINDLVSTSVNRIIQSPWYQDSIPFRHCHTHRYLPDFNISLIGQAGNLTATYLLPDNPLILPHTYGLQREVVTFCKNKVDDCIGDINTLYDDLVNETKNHGHIPF